MAAPGPNELVVLLSLFFSGGFGIPLGVPPEPIDPLLARVAPDECVFYTAWAEMADPDPESPNQTEQLPDQYISDPASLLADEKGILPMHVNVSQTISQLEEKLEPWKKRFGGKWEEMAKMEL